MMCRQLSVWECTRCSDCGRRGRHRIDERFNCLFEIAGLSAWDLSGDAQRKTGCMCDANGDVGTVDTPPHARSSSHGSVNGRSVSGSPCWMVASQLTHEQTTLHVFRLFHPDLTLDPRSP